MANNEDISEVEERIGVYLKTGKTLSLTTIYKIRKQLKELERYRERISALVPNVLTPVEIVEAVKRNIPGFINPVYLDRLTKHLLDAHPLSKSSPETLEKVLDDQVNASKEPGETLPSAGTPGTEKDLQQPMHLESTAQ
jgi:hypothetical protein